ncbi:MAG: 16S rRNA (adenine(1518)-N(6)/adenine(1519)-N(6))-dimethyltransferase RsmA [Clostridiales bacterium]|nr:16S rRNA (adenine(1518)-N(6)/adenine(1519)-N(6))-dimethyltransferase RsmA [Clostridiales bacterium]
MDLTSPKTIKSIAAKFGFTFKKGLGQNFLTNPAVIEEIAEAAGDGGVIEIGPGFGVLTHALAERAKKVVALEIDERLPQILEYTLADCDNVKVLNCDVMKTEFRALIDEEFKGMSVSVAANLPYYITTPIIAKLLEERLPLKDIIIMIQKEVAERIEAKPGTKSYGAITLLCQYFAQPEIITTVSAGQFVPPPKVDSAVLRLRLLDKPRVTVADEDKFFKVIKAAFSQRRKTLLNCLSSYFNRPKEELAKIMEEAGIEPTRRGETLSIDEFAKLCDML